MTPGIPRLTSDEALALLRAQGVIPSEAEVSEVVASTRSLGVSMRAACWPPYGGARSAWSRPVRGRSRSGGIASASSRPETISAEDEAVRAVHPEMPSSSPADLLRDLIEGRIVEADVSLQQHLALRHWCRERTIASTTAIQRLVDMGHWKNARRARDAHLQKPEVLMHALLCAARKRWPTRRDMTSAEMAACRQERLKRAVEQMPKIGHFTKPARARRFLIPKPDGGTRPITDFYWVDKARQIVLKSALIPFANLHDGQFMLARDPDRRGPAAVREALLAALDECGENSRFMQFDIRDFYGSISHDWLEAHLGLDPATIRKHVHTGDMLIGPTGRMTTVRGHHEASRRERGRRGIPQGSALSSLIAEQVMAAVLRGVAVFADLPLFVWSDNIGVIVPRDRAGDVERLVRAAFADHGAGPFQLTVSNRPIVEEFKFLGVWYRKAPARAEAYVPDAVAHAWEASISGRILTAGHDELDALEHRVIAKVSFWAFWHGAVEIRDHLLAQIGSARATLSAE